MSKFISIHITTPDATTAERIGEYLVKQNLVACAQIEGPMKSIYQWKSKLVNDEEWRLTLKTLEANYTLIEKKVLEMHPYDVPQVVSFEIKDGFNEYLAWIDTVKDER